MLHYFREAKVGAPLRVFGQLLEFDAKRARLWMEMRSPHDGPAIAATEQLYLSVRQAEETRAAPWREESLGALASDGRGASATCPFHRRRDGEYR